MLYKVIQRVKSMAGIRALPVFAVAAHDITVMSRDVGTDRLQFGFCVLVRVAMRMPGLTGQGRHASVPALFPEVNE